MKVRLQSIDCLSIPIVTEKQLKLIKNTNEITDNKDTDTENTKKREDLWEHYANKSIPSLFQESVDKYPLKIAVRLDDECLTYEELHTKVYALSSHLVNDLHIQPGSYIGQCVERSIEMIIGILAIMSIGCIYVPLNPKDPIERLNQC